MSKNVDGCAFPVGQAGHGKADEIETVTVTLMLHRMRPGAVAFPSIALLEKDGYDTRVASNGRFVYWWNGSELVALELSTIQAYLTKVIHAKIGQRNSTKITKVVRSVRRVVSKG